VTAANDLLRFALELAGVAALAVWGWVVGGSGLFRYILAIGAPLVLIVVWALFIAPNSDSPLAPTLRALAGSGLLLVAALLLWLVGFRVAAVVFAVLIVVNTILMLVLPA
jgi:hypothetical protein